MFQLKAPYQPSGDQPQAIDSLVNGLNAGAPHQVLLGVTGSGKTFTIASVIARVNRPTLVIAHNKTLAAQLASEFRSFFPDAAVHYFVSYYDYYQPEAYIPHSDTYIEKDSSINEEIDRLRNAATTALLTREDVIIVASVSCIYGLGNPEVYERYHLHLLPGESINQKELFTNLLHLRFERSDLDFHHGTFRVNGEIVDIFPSSGQTAIRLQCFGPRLEQLTEFDPVTGEKITALPFVDIYPATHFVTDLIEQRSILDTIRRDLDRRLKELTETNKLVEAQRLKQRTRYDCELIEETGYCNGIENYSLYFDGRTVGQPPWTLIDYFRYAASRRKNSSLLHPAFLHPGGEDPDPHPRGVPKRGVPAGEGRAENDWLLIIDESHQTVPQLGGMFEGDRSRKEVLVDHGFRLPTAKDNRPLKFSEFESKMPQTIFTSATPGGYELQKIGDGKGYDARIGIGHGNGQNTRHERQNRLTKRVSLPLPENALVEMIVRPTGLLDPAVTVRPTEGQIDNLVREILSRVEQKERVLVTTLTKRMSEDLTEHLLSLGIKVQYLHSDVETLERIEILRNLRLGTYDVLVGINLLREGLDLPEVSLVAILDADKEGFLRSVTSLIQTFGRAARHVNGQVICYADRLTGALQFAIQETNRRRAIQAQHNRLHGIVPKSTTRAIEESLQTELKEHADRLATLASRDIPPEERVRLTRELKAQMELAARNLEFEKAVMLRDEIRLLQTTASRVGRR